VGWATIISTKDTKDSSYYSELEIMKRFPVLKLEKVMEFVLLVLYVLFSGLVGYFVGCTSWRLIIFSEHILWCLILWYLKIIPFSLLLIFMFIAILALVILWIYDRNTTGKLILLFGTFVISLSVLWILLFNLLNVFIPHSPLRICCSLERLSDNALSMFRNLR